MSLVVSGLTVFLGGAEIIGDLDLKVNSGERFAIMGPSGSGKSTLLRTIAGLVQPTVGSIRVDDVEITSLPTHRRPIGLMFQDHALFPHLTVAGNVAYGLRMARTDRSSRQVAVAELLDRVGLSGLADRKPDTLSGGEQQRVALARTIALEPSLIMLDEPLGSLDVALREDLLLHIRSVVEQVGTTSLYVTHDRAEAFAFADRLAVIDEGCIVALGTPEAVWNDPGSVFVATMVGHANVVEGETLGLGPGVFTIPEGSLAIDPAGAITAQVIDSVFDDGRFRVRADVSGTVLAISSDHSETVGADVRIHIDGRAAIRLTP